VDASCYSAANSIKDAYAKMEWVSGAFLYTCTGGLLNDTNPSSTNYFLTANHCLSKANIAKNVSFYWRFRTSSCNGSCPSNSGWPYKTTGAGVASSNRSGDYTLLTLNTTPPAGTTRLGFTNVAVANTNGVALHRVSNPDFGPQVYNEQSVSTSAPTCQGWPRGERIYSRDTLGATDGGSSGSPVVNSSDQVVGQLSGGCGTNVNDPCDAVNNATVDGALAFYFNSVKPFINP
jgi:V8-like Glu-specific endopeptidase